MTPTHRIHLVVIDPQMDFIDTPGAGGSLAVPGAYDDMGRLAKFIERMGDRIYDIHMTLDSHDVLDVSHPRSWVNVQTGEHPAAFTTILPDEIGLSKTWRGLTDEMTERYRTYSKALAARQRYPHIIWPEHCLIGSHGWTVDPRVFGAMLDWSVKVIGGVNRITKGTNPWTEHYSAVQAEIPDPDDPGTQVNVDFVRLLQEADQLILTGEALSHCLANTGRDLYNQFQTLFNPGNTTRMAELILFTDCTSSVPGFENLGADFIRDFKSWGGKVMESTDFAA